MRVARSCPLAAARAATAWPPEPGRFRVLAARNRLTTGTEFRLVVRRGRRCAGTFLVVHQLAGGSGTPVVGFVVARNVGNAVLRNLVRRRLRHLVRERLASLPEDGMLVVRALPPAGAASYGELGAELDRLLTHDRGRPETARTVGAGSR